MSGVKLTVERIQPRSPLGMPRRMPFWLIKHEDGSVITEMHDQTLGIAFDIQAREIERLRAELAFYADPDNWVSPSKGFAAQYDPEPSPVHRVRHHRAAAALQPKEGEG